MKNYPIHHNEQGSAILIVLGILTLVLVLALVFVGTSRNARTVALASADNTKAGLLAESAAARVESIIYYLQEQSLGFIPTHATNSDLEYHWAPYAGAFQIDSNLTEFSNGPDVDETTHLPIKIQHFRGYESVPNVNKIKNQFLFYTHDSYNKLDAAHRPYGLLAATNYGDYLNSSTINFSGNLNKSSGKAATNFTYRNILDTNGLVLGRYAFMLLPEGTKFNVNQMAMAKEGANDNYVPSVDMGVISPNASDPGTNFDQEKESTFAISGYEYDSDGKITGLANSGKYIEEDTLQYGLHPQELRVSEDVIELADNLKLDNKNYPPQWFNYDNLLSVNNSLWTSGDKPLRDFYSLYTLYSGLDDREVVFHGRVDETIDDCSTDSPKINLAYPGNPNSTDPDARKTWDELSEILVGTGGSAANPTYLQSNFENIFGEALYTDAGDTTTLFKDDSDEDVTPTVLANLVDFCDEDDFITYDATLNNTTRLEFDTSIDTSSTIQVNFAGNEKTPAVIGVGLELTNCNRTATNGTGTSSGTWSVTGSGTTSYKLRVVLQNYFNEPVDLPEKIRVVIKGKINPWYAGYYIDAGTNHYQFHGCTHSVDLPSGYAALHANPTTYDFSADAKSFVIDKTFTPTSGAQLGAREVDDTTIYDDSGAFELSLASVSNVPGKLERAGVWLQVTDILVMTADGADKLMDIAYANGDSHTILWTKNAVRIVMPWAQYHPLAWAIAQDPRCNHKDWQWYDALEGSGYNWTVDATVGIATSAAFGMQDKLRAAALKYIQTYCKNGNLSISKDLEPELNLITGTTGSGVVQTMNTFSTAFIPNHPITSLWQLGAVSRGLPAQTINLKKYGGPKGGLKYADGDAWLLDYFKLNEVSPDQPFPGKFNPNCFNALSYRYLLANIPVNVGLVPADPTSPVDEDNPDPAWVYQPGRLDIDDVARTKFHYDWIDTAPEDTQVIDLENQLFIFTEDLDFEQHQNDEYIAPKQAEKQSWSPVEAFFNFVQIRNTPTYRVATVQADGTLSGWAQQKANDRLAESLIGCSAGLLSTRYEYFTVFAVGQGLKYIGQTHTNTRDDYLPVTPVKPEDNYVSGTNQYKDFYNQLVNPVKIKASATEEGWYSVLSTQMRLMTIERDCWFNTMKVVRTQLY